MKLPKSLTLVTEQEAIKRGLTHEGSIFGIPCWIRVTQNEVHSAAKIPLLDKLFPVLDFWYTTIIGWLPLPGNTFELPHTVGRRITNLKL